MKQLSYMTHSIYKAFFKALSNETRFNIITRLKSKPLSVNEICEQLDIEQSYASHNLSCLVGCGFVSMEKDGNKRIYSIEPAALEILNLIDKHITKYQKHMEDCPNIFETLKER